MRAVRGAHVRGVQGRVRQAHQACIGNANQVLINMATFTRLKEAADEHVEPEETGARGNAAGQSRGGMVWGGEAA